MRPVVALCGLLGLPACEIGSDGAPRPHVPGADVGPPGAQAYRASFSTGGVTDDDFRGPPSVAPSHRPILTAPIGGAMWPRNLGAPLLRFLPGAGNDHFRLRVSAPELDVTIAFAAACDTVCGTRIPDEAWVVMAPILAGRVANLTLNASAGAGSPVSTGAASALRVSPEPVVGGLIYTSYEGAGILRSVTWRDDAVEPGTLEIAPGTSSNPKDCAGCHSVSRDGTHLAATYGHGDDFLGITSTADPAAFSMVPRDVRSNFQTFNPDGTRLISNFDGKLVLRDGATGDALGPVPLGFDASGALRRGIQPDWSHDGRAIAFVLLRPESGLFYDVASCCGKKEGGDWLAADAGDIAILPTEPDGASFGAPRVVMRAVPGKAYHYYPSFSPDDRWLVFDTGTSPGLSPPAQQDSGGFSYGVPAEKLVSYDQTTSRLRLVSVDGGAAIDLDAATADPWRAGVTASWPRFAPSAQRGGRLLFVIFSSKRSLDGPLAGPRAQLWLAAIDLDRKGDPSLPPVWLPFQDPATPSHFPSWSDAPLP